MSLNVEHKVIVTGAPLASGDTQPRVYPRLPIEELIKDKKQFSLYVQAIDMLMNKDPGDMLSWFQISGIHGQPVQPWDNVGGDAGTDSGYCTHGSVLFPTWHRPYVLLFEQALVGCAVTIAERYTGADADAWKEAAISLRSPYWDWAHNSIPPREVIEYEKLSVLGPSGSEIILDPNPLLGYRFQDGTPEVDRELHRRRTVRCPTSDNNVSNLEALLEALAVLDPKENELGNIISMRRMVWDTLTQTKTWDAFSNKGSPADSSHSNTVNSLETLHGKIHVVVGGGGHMGSIDLSAFDPIFWLHHTNVDRLLALWQALHPGLWVSKGIASGTFTTRAGSQVDQSTDLTPFWNGATTFFKSSSPGVREWQLLGYDYPEFVQIPADTDTRVAISAAVSRLYQYSVTRTTIPHPPTDATTSMMGVGITRGVVPGVDHPMSSLIEADAAPRTSTWTESTVASGNEIGPRLDWFARIRVQPNKVGSSFSVLLFVGAPPQHEHDWRTAKNLIGIHGEFVNSRPEQCANCRENMDALTEGFIGLTRALRARSLYGRAVHDIEEYLSTDLEWRVQKTDATIVPPSEVPGLEIAVMTVPLEFSEEWQEWIKCDELPTTRKVTQGRAGGCSLPHEE